MLFCQSGEVQKLTSWLLSYKGVIKQQQLLCKGFTVLKSNCFGVTYFRFLKVWTSRFDAASSVSSTMKCVCKSTCYLTCHATSFH